MQFQELELYNKDLLAKPAMLLVNKLDSEGGREKYRDLKPSLINLEKTFVNLPEEMRPQIPIKFDEIMGISAKTEPHDVEKVKDCLRHLLDYYAEKEQESTENPNMYNQMSNLVAEKGPKLI